MAPRIENYSQWRTHILHRLTHQIDVSADPTLVVLLDELKGYPIPDGHAPHSRGETPSLHDGVVVPLRLRMETGTLSFFSTTTVFGTAVDVTLSELAIEAFFPADVPTAEAMRQALSPL